MKASVLAAKIYADIFDWPLTQQEARRWAIREQRESYAREKLIKAKEIVFTLSRLPTILAIFLTGSVATGNARKNADLDLLIVTYPYSLWITRLFVVLYLKFKKIYQNLICPNIFLDANHLEISEKNLYTAHEILQAKCLYDKNNIYKLWLSKNSWTKNYLPNAYKTPTPVILAVSRIFFVLFPLEILAFIFQYLYQLPKQTNENISLGSAFFHPRNLSQKVLQEYEKRLQLSP